MVADVVRNQPPSVWVDGREQVKPRGAARVLLIVLVDIAVKRLPVAGVYARHKYRGDERGERVKAEVEWNAERLQASKANGHGRLARLAREVYVARVGLRIIRQSHIALGINVVGYMQRLVLGELLVRRVHDPPMEAVLELGKDAHGREHQTEPLGNGIGRPDCGDGANEHASCSGTLQRASLDEVVGRGLSHDLRHARVGRFADRRNHRHRRLGGPARSAKAAQSGGADGGECIGGSKRGGNRHRGE
mmetsp:Transcript_45444/g.125395  ORF Transcript_45444/g.125395 Transcript_45444/m.125395 type:complete len:248 (+) Transcript_45444:1110-1853(+)